MTIPGKALMDMLNEVEDPRRASNGTLHNFQEILVIAICAVLSDADNVEDFAEWGRTKEAWLRNFLVLKNGIPSEKTFFRVFSALNPAQFETVFRRWVGGILPAVSRTIAVDGKTLRGSAKGDDQPAHMVSAFATDVGLVLGQEKVTGKSNEIVCHERNRRRFGGRGVSLEMRVGPSKPAYRSRFQTATSCVGKESTW